MAQQKRFRLLPVLIAIATAAFVLKLGETFAQAQTLIKEASAQEKQPEVATEETKPSDDKLANKDEAAAADEKKDEKAVEAEAEKAAEKTDDKPSEKPKVKLPSTKQWSDASESEIDYSNVRAEVYKDLMARRQQLDEKEKQLAQKEALLKAAEAEIGKKTEEMNAIKSEIQGLLKQQTAEEKQQITKLVRIYEGMKPKDAARIFNSLDMDVLISVVSLMQEKKTAPILALMEAEKARSLTTFLAEQRALPKEGDLGADEPLIP